MNRKEGIDYFPVKCAADKNIELVTAECGLKAHAVIYALLQEIYGVHGYYCEWQRERALLISSRMFGGGDKAVKGKFISIDEADLDANKNKYVKCTHTFPENRIMVRVKEGAEE